MTKRTDKHCPSNLIPGDYAHALTFAHAGGGYDAEPSYCLDVLRQMMETERFFRPGNTSRCDVCGAAFRFGDVLRHADGEHIIVGWECCEKIIGLQDRAEFLRGLGIVRAEALQEARRSQKAEQLAEFLAAHEGLEAALAGEHRILQDLSEKLSWFGSLSDAQVELALKIKRELDAPRPLVNIPEGRTMIEGRVVSTKRVEGFRGMTLKMLVEVDTPEGSYRVFGSVPSGIRVDRGDRVRITATLKRSDRDPSFGFFSRPTGAARIDADGVIA
jgi:ribosomal protein L9